MTKIAGFEQYRFSAGEDLFISITGYGLTFSKSSVKCLGYSRYVAVFFDRKGKRIAVIPGNPEEEEEIRDFVKDREARNAGFVRWNDKRFMRDVIALGQLDLGEKGVRVFGEYDMESHAIIYDLKRAEPITGRNKE